LIWGPLTPVRDGGEVGKVKITPMWGGGGGAINGLFFFNGSEKISKRKESGSAEGREKGMMMMAV
jgi:hypothetical protein